MSNEAYITVSRVLSALAVIIMIVVGWLFTLLVDTSRETRTDTEELRERMAVTETKIEDLEEVCNK